LTLLAVELSTIILESIKEVSLETHSALILARKISILTIDYFTTFTVIYDF
jgi:hypothetical protein